MVVVVNLSLIMWKVKSSILLVNDSAISQELYLGPDFRFLKEVENLERI